MEILLVFCHEVFYWLLILNKFKIVREIFFICVTKIREPRNICLFNPFIHNHIPIIA